MNDANAEQQDEAAYSPAEFPRLRGHCPACGNDTLFRGSQGYITCSWLKCPNPGAAHDKLSVSRTDAPKVICLCGSTRFIDMFAVKTWELELEGYIVLGCTLLPAWYCDVRHHFAEKCGVKGQRDEHHKRKIDMADRVLVLNYEGYIGESTRNEIDYATRLGKPVDYVESLAMPNGTQARSVAVGEPQNDTPAEIPRVKASV